MTATVRRTRLTSERESELYQAVIDLVREVGYEAMTMDAVAARSRSSKATLYRQWQGKPQLVAAAMRHTAFVWGRSTPAPCGATCTRSPGRWAPARRRTRCS